MLALDPGAWKPETWTAVAALVTVGVYVVIAVMAFIQVREARRLREAQARPFVVAEFVPGFLIMFRVRNLGHTLARNVRLKWDHFPIVTTGRNDPLWQDSSKSVLFSTGIPYLPPGQAIETLFDHFADRVSQALPMQYQITVDYDTFDERHHFSESYHLDLELYRGLRHIERKDIHDVATALGKIRDTMGRWTDSSRGLSVITSDRARVSRNEDRPYRITEARRILRAQGWRGLVRKEWHDYLTRHGFYTLD